MDDMVGSCVLYVKVGTFGQLEHNTICVLTITKMRIVMVTVQHDLIITVSFM